MKLDAHDLHALLTVARHAARSAGNIVAAAHRPHSVRYKAGRETLAAQILTDTDLRSQEAILAHLVPTLERYDLALLTEESPDNGGRLCKDFHWSVDPLDGTLYFAEGVPGYAISIALVSRDGIPWIGVVCDPVDGTLYHAVRGGGACRNDVPWQSRKADSVPLTLLADRSYAESPDYAAACAYWNHAARQAGLPGLDSGTCGGAVYNALHVIHHAPAVYYKPARSTGGGSLWDYAAAACIVREAGGIVSDLTGNPLDLNRPDSTYANHRSVLFASNPAWAAAVQHYMRTMDNA